MAPKVQTGLILILRPDDPPAELGALLRGGRVAALRLASAGFGAEALSAAAKALKAAAGEVPVLIDDHYRLAAALGLDGVHLSDGTRSLREARRHLGPEANIGAFCGASRHAGMTAAEMTADYVSFGPLSADPLLGGGEVAGAELFEWWAEMIEVPVVAEGGLTPESAATLAGIADFLALGREAEATPAGLRPWLRALGRG
jgi:thiamine-phosphate pyrophosphorylase